MTAVPHPADRPCFSDQIAWRWRGLLAERRGATALEFALITPILMAMLLGMAQLALALSALYEMHDAVSDAGRRIAIGELEPTTAETFILARLGAAAPLGADGASAAGEGETTSGSRHYAVIASQTETAVMLTVSLAFAEIDFFDVFGFFSGRDLTVSMNIPLVGA